MRTAASVGQVVYVLRRGPPPTLMHPHTITPPLGLQQVATLAGFFISQLSLFLRLAAPLSHSWHNPLADFALLANGIGGLLLTIGSAIFIQATSHAAFLGIGTILILFWMFVMAFLLHGVWAHLLKLAALCSLVGFALTMRAAATKDPVLLPVGEYMVLGGISIYLYLLGGYLWGQMVEVQLDIVGKESEPDERFIRDRFSMDV